MKKLLASLLAVMMLALPLAGLAEMPADLVVNALGNGRSVTVVTSNVASDTVKQLAALLDETGTATALLDMADVMSHSYTVQNGQLAVVATVGDYDLGEIFAVKDGALYIAGDLNDQAVVIDATEIAWAIRRIGTYLTKNGADESVVAVVNGCADALEQDGVVGLADYIAGACRAYAAEQFGMTEEELQAMIGDAYNALSEVIAALATELQELPGEIT